MKLNLLNQNQEMNIQQFKEENSKLKNEIESLKPEPRDEQSSDSKKRIPNSKMKLNLLNLNQEMNNLAIQRSELQTQR
jgi:hypothetical protein